MKITKFTAINFMNLKDVEIIPDDNLVMIVGPNEAGKSSILEAISCIFQGKKFDPPTPIKDGADSAEVAIETESLTMKCVWSNNKRKLTVTGLNDDGNVVAASKQQALLTDVVGHFAFDPMNFITLSTTVPGRREQAELIKKIVGLDFSDIDAKLVDCKTKRSAVKTAKETYEHQAAAITVPAGTPNVEVSVVELAGELANAVAHNGGQSQILQNLDTCNVNITNNAQNLTTTEESIAGLEDRLSEVRRQFDVLMDSKIAFAAEKQNLTESIQDGVCVSDIEEQIAVVSQTNEAVLAKKNKTALGRSALDKAEEFSELGRKLREIESEKSTRLSEAKMPVEGLSVDDDGVTYKGLPLYKNTNTAKQLEIAMAIAMADDPDLKVLRMSGNDLDPNSLKAVVEMVTEKGWQCWMERVGDETSGGVYIEDGEIK